MQKFKLECHACGTTWADDAEPSQNLTAKFEVAVEG